MTRSDFEKWLADMKSQQTSTTGGA
jgi:hypothetical protein